VRRPKAGREARDLEGKGGAGRGKDRGANKRVKKDAKFGFGGKKRYAKSGDAVSSGDISGFSSRKMKSGGAGGRKVGGGGGSRRLGKSKRGKA
jgi:rRNA-processing protein EBP2